MQLPFWLATSIYSALFPLFLLTAVPAAPPVNPSYREIVSLCPMERVQLGGSRECSSVGVFYLAQRVTHLIHEALLHRYLGSLLS